MNANDYVQTQCPKCGAQAWGHNMQPVPCNACGQPIPPLASSAWNPASPYGVAQPPGAAAMQHMQQNLPPGAQAFQQQAPNAGFGNMSNNGAPPLQQQSGGPSVNVQMPFGMKIPVKIPVGGSKAKMGAGIAAVAVLGIAGAVVKSKIKGGGSKAGVISYSSLNMDVKKIDPDTMIAATESAAKKWRSDAVFLSINLNYVHADGTVDSSNGGNQVEWVSLSRIHGASKSARTDAFKKFNFGPSGVDYSSQWDALEKSDATEGPPVPKCTVKQIVKQLNAKGLTGDKVVHITYDPTFSVESWHVLGDDPKLNEFYSIEDCSPTKE